MKPQQLMATGEWSRSGEWPGYAGAGPRYEHGTLDIVLQGFATQRNSRRAGRGITKVRSWRLTVNGQPVSRDSRFALLANQAAVIAANSATGCNYATVITARQRQEVQP
jgi:hypothetical protein